MATENPIGPIRLARRGASTLGIHGRRDSDVNILVIREERTRLTEHTVCARRNVFYRSPSGNHHCIALADFVTLRVGSTYYTAL